MTPIDPLDPDLRSAIVAGSPDAIASDAAASRRDRALQQRLAALEAARGAGGSP